MSMASRAEALQKAQPVRVIKSFLSQPEKEDDSETCADDHGVVLVLSLWTHSRRSC
jgi:hypothetical protein